ncbi:Short-chain dehydrogenase/reductase family 16C member 6, partial [Armadillidium nasatum]
TAKAFLPGMIEENSGHIVTIASLAGLFGINKLVDYCSSKFAAVGFDESLRMELHVLGHKGIHTTVVCPYYINTGMFEGVQSRLIPILEQEYVADEIADAILIQKVRIILPWICRVLFVLKNIMPNKTAIKVYKAMSGKASLNNLMNGTKAPTTPSPHNDPAPV